jgi:predicted phage tail protein
MPQITFLNQGKIISVWTGAAWLQTNSSNPAWIVWDMLTNSLYGAGMASSRLDLASFKRWADHCDAQSLYWNGPLDVETNVWDATQYVLRVGRAQLVNIGTRWSVVVEKAQTPTMMFSVANMVKGSYRESWLPMNDRANEIDVTYFDEQDDYKRRTLKVYDPAALAAGQAPKNSSITLYGVTQYDRAYKEGMFMLNLNRYILKTVSFRAPTEAITCTVGDLIYVQHDMPHWSDAGRIAAKPIA